MQNKNKDVSLKLNYGYFVHCNHDLRGGLEYHGVFENEEDATNFANSKKGYDEVEVLHLPYVTYNGRAYALWDGTIAVGTRIK